MNKYEELKRDLKIAYLIYENNNLNDTLKYLDRILLLILNNERILENDPFWKMLTYDIFKTIVLNNFYNQNVLTINDLKSLFENEDEVKKNIKEFCDKFKDNELITFINDIENISDNLLKKGIKILIDNIGKIKVPADKVELPKIVVVEYLKKIYPFIYKRCERKPLDNYSTKRKEFQLYVDKTFIDVINCYDALKFLAQTPLLKNPIPMCTQSEQVDQDTIERKTWQLDSFDINLSGFWIKALEDNCEYEIYTETALPQEQRKYNLNKGSYFSIIVEEKFIKNIDISLIDNIFNCIVDFLEYQHNNKIQNFIEGLHEKYEVSYDELLSFFQQLPNHPDIFKEFFKELITESTYYFTSDELAVKRNKLTAKSFFKKYNLSYFEAYQCLVQLAEHTHESKKKNKDGTKQSVQEAITNYTNKFGGFPHFLFMGASDETIISAINEALKNNKEITSNNSVIDY